MRKSKRRLWIIGAAAVVLVGAAGLASLGRPGSASRQGRPAEPAGLVCDYFAAEKWVVGHRRSKSRTLFDRVS